MARYTNIEGQGEEALVLGLPAERVAITGEGKVILKQWAHGASVQLPLLPLCPSGPWSLSYYTRVRWPERHFKI